MSIVLAFEGDTDEPVARKLAVDAGLTVSLTYDNGGKDRLDQRMAGFNAAARHAPWLVIRDLDHDADCAPSWLSARRWRAARFMAFRIAVRATEAWLMADRKALADFLRVPAEKVPANPDLEEDPARTLVNLARRSSSSSIRQAMVPAPGRVTTVGPLYEATIIEFGREMWDVKRAAANSASLERARARLRAVWSLWTATTAAR